MCQWLTYTTRNMPSRDPEVSQDRFTFTVLQSVDRFLTETFHSTSDMHCGGLVCR